jgi:hypothetical protein
VTIDEIRHAIITSSPADWERLRGRALFGLQWLEEAVTGGQHQVRVAEHTSAAVHRAEPDLKLAWGLHAAEGLAFEGFAFPDRSVTRVQADALWRGQQVITWTVLSADGARYYLPDPEPLLTPGATPGNAEITAWTATESQVAVARLLHELTPGACPFGDGMQQSGMIMVPD